MYIGEDDATTTPDAPSEAPASPEAEKPKKKRDHRAERARRRVAKEAAEKARASKKAEKKAAKKSKKLARKVHKVMKRLVKKAKGRVGHDSDQICISLPPALYERMERVRLQKKRRITLKNGKVVDLPRARVFVEAVEGWLKKNK